jgi:hypothetical protein
MTTHSPKCDWCGATMRVIADHGSGMARDSYEVWLCNNPTCGHERELLKPGAAADILRRYGFGQK